MGEDRGCLRDSPVGTPRIGLKIRVLPIPVDGFLRGPFFKWFKGFLSLRRFKGVLSLFECILMGVPILF